MPALETIRRCLPARLARYSYLFSLAESYFGVDPFLMAAIMDRESLGGNALKPLGPGGVGDGGHGRGLYQIDDRSHASFCAARFDSGGTLWADPLFNAAYAFRLFAKNLKECNGDTLTAIAGYNAGIGRAITAGKNPDARQRQLDLDKITTGGDYVSDVLDRVEEF